MIITVNNLVFSRKKQREEKLLIEKMMSLFSELKMKK